MPGPVRYRCPDQGQITPIILCDNNGPFIRVFGVSNGNVTITDTTLDGAPYVTVGPIVVCPDAEADVEQMIFCDDNAGVITPYMVAYEYDETGAIVSTTITLIDGVTPYVPTGTTVVCSGEDGNSQAVVLCDDDTPFVRHILYNNVGTVLSTFDTELDMVTPYVVAGTVGLCEFFDSYPVPSGASNDERLTVTSAVVATTSMVITAGTTLISWRAEGGAGRFTIDGTNPVSNTNPAAGNGNIVRNNDSDIWHVDTWNAAKWIANTAQDVVIHANQMKLKAI